METLKVSYNANGEILKEFEDDITDKLVELDFLVYYDAEMEEDGTRMLNFYIMKGEK